MYNKVISKIRCYSPNRKNTPIRNYNNLYYIATREGVDLHPLNDELQEDMQKGANNELYLRYIHERPRSNGLFGSIETNDINAVCQQIKELSESTCIYRGILSLDERDAKELGFMDKSAWNDYLTLALPEVAEVLGIPAPELEWVAAFHQESGHPHVHYMLWDKRTDHVRSPYISIPQQHRCRELLSGRIFQNEQSLLVKEKNLSRTKLLNSGKLERQTVIQQLVDDICQQPSYKTLGKVNHDMLSESSKEMAELLNMLPSSGSIKYAYLPPEVKEQVGKVVATMLQKKELKNEYDQYLDYHTRLAKTYSPTQKELKVAILKCKEDIDRRLANIVLKAAQSFRKEKDFYYALQNTRFPTYKNMIKDYPEALSDETIRFLKDEIETGSNTSSASFLLAKIYDDPNSEFYNPEDAIKYYQISSDADNPYAKAMLGNKYLWGKNVKQDVDLGRRLLHEAQGSKFEDYCRSAEKAFDSYQHERVNYQTVSLMSNLLQSLCRFNKTYIPSAYERSFDTSNVKALQERFKHLQHDRAKEP